MLQDRKLNATVHTIHQRGALDWRSQSKKKEIPVCRSIPLTQTVNNCFFPPTSVCDVQQLERLIRGKKIYSQSERDRV